MTPSRLVSVPLAFALLTPTAFSAHAAATTDGDFCGVAVPGYTVTRLTNNQKLNTSVTPLENGKAAWLELSADGSGTGKLIYFDGTNRQTLSERVDMDHGRGGFVAAGSGKIAWEENMGGDRLDIFFFDGTSVTRLTRPDGDITNRGVSVNESGNVAWVRTLSDPTPGAPSGSTPTQLYGESRVMLWDGRSIQTISPANRSATDRGVFYSTTFSHGALTWIAIESSQAHANPSDDRYSVYRYKDGALTSHILSDLPGGSYFFNYVLTDTGIIYEPKPLSTSDLVYRSYQWATNSTTDLTRIPGGSDSSFVAQSDRFGSTVFSPQIKTYFWTGTEQREVGHLTPASYSGHLNTDDIRSDGGSVLYTANSNSPTNPSQIFTYSVANNTLSQFTNTSGTGGALGAQFGNNGEIYWTVFSSTAYQPTDICVARPVSTTAPGSGSVKKTSPTETAPAPTSTPTIEEGSCSEESSSSYTRTLDEAGQALKSSALVSFDVQASYRLKATINKNRLPSVKIALNDARKKLVTDLDAVLAAQHRTNQTRLNNGGKVFSDASSLAAFDTAWKTMTNALLPYASAQDKKSINRVLSTKKSDILSQYRAVQSEMYANTAFILNACQLEK